MLKTVGRIAVVVLVIVGVIALSNSAATHVTKVKNTFKQLGTQMDRVVAIVQIHENYLQTERGYKKYVKKLVEEAKAKQVVQK